VIAIRNRYGCRTTAKRRKRPHGRHDWGEGDEPAQRPGTHPCGIRYRSRHRYVAERGLAAAPAAGRIGRIEPPDPADGSQRFNVAIAASA